MGRRMLRLKLAGMRSWKSREESDGCIAGELEVFPKHQLLSWWARRRSREKIGAEDCPNEEEQALMYLMCISTKGQNNAAKKISLCSETTWQTLGIIKEKVNLQCRRTGNPVKWPNVHERRVNKSEITSGSTDVRAPTQPGRQRVSHTAFICIKDRSMSTLLPFPLSISLFIPQCFSQAVVEFVSCQLPAKGARFFFF